MKEREKEREREREKERKRRGDMRFVNVELEDLNVRRVLR
jgi:hypothetical protein